MSMVMGFILFEKMVWKKKRDTVKPVNIVI